MDGEVIARPSPNFGPRREGLTPDLVVIHYTAMACVDDALERLCATAHEVSAHYLVSRDGRLWQLVDEEMRAWHAGSGRWAGRSDLNSRSIGIELDNSGAFPFPEPQMQRLELLLSGILRRWRIPPAGVIGHQDFAPDRKGDPGRRFDWRRLALAGLAAWPEPGTPTAPDETCFLNNTATFGYPVEAGLAPVLDAVRARFRPYATGPLDRDDMALAAGLAALAGVDQGGSGA
jgi:N-acetylmuramoyl-L-alanine amidase